MGYWSSRSSEIRVLSFHISHNEVDDRSDRSFHQKARLHVTVSVSLYPNNICWIPAGNLFACDALEIHYKGLAWWRSYFQITWDDKFVRDSDPIVRDWSIHPNKFWDQNYILIGSGTASRRGDSWPTEYIKRSNRLIVMTLRKISLFSILTTYPSSITLKLSQHIKRLQRCCLTGSRKINRLCLCV